MFAACLNGIKGEALAIAKLKGFDGVLELPAPLVPGSRVRVLEGPFAGCEADLLSLDGQRRALVLLELLGRSNPVALPLDVLAPTN